jgi:hypothetical protein
MHVDAPLQHLTKETMQEVVRLLLTQGPREATAALARGLGSAEAPAGGPASAARPPEPTTPRAGPDEGLHPTAEGPAGAAAGEDRHDTNAGEDRHDTAAGKDGHDKAGGEDGHDKAAGEDEGPAATGEDEGPAATGEDEGPAPTAKPAGQGAGPPRQRTGAARRRHKQPEELPLETLRVCKVCGQEAYVRKGVCRNEACQLNTKQGRGGRTAGRGCRGGRGRKGARR